MPTPITKFQTYLVAPERTKHFGTRNSSCSLFGQNCHARNAEAGRRASVAMGLERLGAGLLRGASGSGPAARADEAVPEYAFRLVPSSMGPTVRTAARQQCRAACHTALSVATRSAHSLAGSPQASCLQLLQAVA